jgi:hypothetical protein
LINSDASGNLKTALHDTTLSGSTYSTNPAITFITDSGRGGSYMNGLLKIFFSKYVSTYSAIVSSQLTASNKPFAAYNPAVLSNPVVSASIDLHPLPFPGMDGAVSGAAIALYLGMISQVLVILASHAPLVDLGVRYDHRIIAKAMHLLLGSIVLGFWPAISVVWFGYEISSSGFFAYWAFLSLGMAAFGSTTIMNYHFFGTTLGGMANIILFALNQAASTATLPLELQSPFFQIGLALPYTQIITGARHILYGSKALNIGQSVGVLCAWVGFAFLFASRLAIRRRRFAYIGKMVTGVSKQTICPLNPILLTPPPSPVSKPLPDSDDTLAIPSTPAPSTPIPSTPTPSTPAPSALTPSTPTPSTPAPSALTPAPTLIPLRPTTTPPNHLLVKLSSMSEYHSEVERDHSTVDTDIQNPNIENPDMENLDIEKKI